MCVILLSCVLRRLVVFCRTSRMSPAGLLTFGFGEVTRLTVPSRVALEGRKSTTHVAGGGNSATLCASSVALCALSRLCLLLRWRCCARAVGWADLLLSRPRIAHCLCSHSSSPAYRARAAHCTLLVLAFVLARFWGESISAYRTLLVLTFVLARSWGESSCAERRLSRS